MTVKNDINWPAVETFIDEYANSYELIGEDDEGREGSYNPTEGEIYMISDAIRGLLDDDEFLALISTAPTQPSPAESEKEAVRNADLEESFARGITGAMQEGDGVWRSCSGCHELNEGHDTGAWSDVFKCHLGNGCRECGGIGAIWDDTDYDAMAIAMAKSMQEQPAQPSDREMLDFILLHQAELTESVPGQWDAMWANADGETEQSFRSHDSPREAIKAAMRVERER